MRSLRGRHGVMAVEIRDPREQELTPMGDVWVIDPETGRQVQVNTTRRKVRERFAAAAAAEREEVARALRRAGADHVVLSTEGDWLRELADHLRRGEAALRAGAVARRRRRLPPRRRPTTRAVAPRTSRSRPAMSFGEPILLLGLVLVPLALLVYVLDAAAQARARRRRSPTRR